MRHGLILGMLLGVASAAVAQTAPPAAPVTPAVVDPAAVPATAATAPTAPVAAVPATPAPPPLPTDRRVRVQHICLTEAKSKAEAAGATDVILHEVKDTDLKSDGFASMKAKVEIVTVDSKGKTKRKKGTFGCSTKNDLITSFKFD